MSKSEGRGVKKYLPSIALVVRVFVALVAIKVVANFVYKYVPPTVAPFLPNLV
jgi:hypothetical protein